MSSRRLVPVVLGVLLVVAGLAGFLALDGLLADVLCGLAVVAGIVVVRLGSRPAPDEIV
jgi:Flp pilus assembly protein CpaB